MKKNIALVTCFFIMVSLAACGRQSTTDESSASIGQSESPALESEQTGKSSFVMCQTVNGR